MPTTKPCSTLRFASLLLAWLLPLCAGAQAPRGYYQFPINARYNNLVSGTMGEIRHSHFHAGLDIKTEGVVGLPVLAAAGGYISRVKVSAYGYGLALYVAHPNGTTTVYGHLETFMEPVASWVLEQQYARSDFSVDLYPKAGQFPVEKGEQIALSGNTGGSAGAHLHFEIRNAAQQALPPFSAGFPELADEVPPSMMGLRIRPLAGQATVEGSFATLQETIKGQQGRGLTLGRRVHAVGQIGLELQGFDRVSHSWNKCGIHTLQVLVEGKQVFRCTVDQVTFATSRHVLQHYDYTEKHRQGRVFTRLYVADGNKLPYYKGSGAISVEEGDTLRVDVVAVDLTGNRSELTFDLVGATPARRSAGFAEGWQLNENLMIFAGRDSLAQVYAGGQVDTLAASYGVSGRHYFQLDLRKTLPDSIDVGDRWLCPLFRAQLVPGKSQQYRHPRLTVATTSATLFDTLYLQADHSISQGLELFSAANEWEVFAKNIGITLHPAQAYDQDRTRAYRWQGGQWGYEGGQWSDAGLSFRTRSGGTFALLTDTVPPELQVRRANTRAIEVRVTDDLSGIGDWQSTANGEFLLWRYLPKRRLLVAVLPPGAKTFQGDIELTLRDQVGNSQSLLLTL